MARAGQTSGRGAERRGRRGCKRRDEEPRGRRGTSDAAENPAVVDLERETREVRALIAGQLDPAVDPGPSSRSRSSTRKPFASTPSVFARCCARSTEPRAAAERRRRTRARARRRGRPGRRRRPGSLDGRASIWIARGSRSTSCPSIDAAELLAAHALRSADAAAAPSEAQLREREAEEQRQAALHAAQSARTEAERLVADGARAAPRRRARAGRARRGLRATEEGDRRAARRDHRLAAASARGARASRILRRSDVRRSPSRAAFRARRALRGARPARRRAERGPRPGSRRARRSPRRTWTRAPPAKERDRVEAEARRLEAEEESIRRERAAQLFDEIDTLNGERLALLARSLAREAREPSPASPRRDGIRPRRRRVS